MATYTATVRWQRGEGEAFTDNKYSRGHQWSFDGGVSFRASSSPHVVPRFSDPTGVDPEEAYVASLSSCHMLTFLYVAAKKGFVVDSYEDTAEGAMAKNDKGRFWVSAVTLHPRVVYSSAKIPDQAAQDEMHHAAHDECFIANSVLTEIRVEPVS
jgi:organic hydroperoxide reductase OsmC/OhrA